MHGCRCHCREIGGFNVIGLLMFWFVLHRAMCAWAEQERAKETDRGLQRLEQREAMADKAEEVTKMAVTVFHCKEVGVASAGNY